MSVGSGEGLGRLSLVSVMLAALGAFACSSGRSGGASEADDDGGAIVGTGAAIDAGASDASEQGPRDYPAFHPSMPAIQRGTLAAIASPVVIPLYFQGETQRTALDAALTKWVASPYFASALGEYGVGTGTAGASIAFDETPAATTTVADIDAWLAGKLDGSHPQLGAVDAPTLGSKVFVLFYPAATTIAFDGATSCKGFMGLHRGVTLASGAVAHYALVPRCAPPPGTSAIDALTSITTGLVASAVTDPYLPTAPASGYRGFDAAHGAYDLGNDEIGTACDLYRPMTPPDLAVAIARTWSNANAAAYREPCIPAPDAQPYFVAVPGAPDDVTLQNGATAKGIKVAWHKQVRLSAQLLSEGPTTGPWTVSAKAAQPGWQFTFTPVYGSNGDTLDFTITNVGAAGPSQFMVISELNGRTSTWFGLVAPN